MLKPKTFSSSLDEEEMMNLHGWFDSVLMLECRLWSAMPRSGRCDGFSRL